MTGGWRIGRTIGLALVTLALASACEGGDDVTEAQKTPAAADSETSTTAASEDRSPGATAGQATPGGGATGDAPPAAAENGGRDLGSPEELDRQLGDIEIAVEFASACAVAGQPQTITIRSEPEIGLAYHAIYSDGKTGFDEGYYGGNNGGQADESGVWRDSWVVKPGAPAGRVRVDVVAKSATDSGYQVAGFEIAGAGGTCST